MTTSDVPLPEDGQDAATILHGLRLTGFYPEKALATILRHGWRLGAKRFEQGWDLHVTLAFAEEAHSLARALGRPRSDRDLTLRETMALEYIARFRLRQLRAEAGVGQFNDDEGIVAGILSGAAAGALVAGPAGALVGAALGHLFLDDKPILPRAVDTPEDWKGTANDPAWDSVEWRRPRRPRGP